MGLSQWNGYDICHFVYKIIQQTFDEKFSLHLGCRFFDSLLKGSDLVPIEHLINFNWFFLHKVLF